jgi:hypothetical protein
MLFLRLHPVQHDRGLIAQGGIAMNQSEKRVVQLVLDDGGPFTIWQEKDREGRRGGLLVTARVCSNPGCDCRDVWLEARGIDERYTEIEVAGETLHYKFVPKAGEPAEPPPMRCLSARLDMDSSQVDFSPGAPPERCDPELLAQLRKGLDRNYLDRLRKRWRLTKGIDQDRWRQRDWSWWKPGDMVSWLEVHPDDFNLMFELDGAVYWADDMYCINPDCSCKEVGLVFSRLSSEKGVERVGAISVTLPSCRFVGVLGEQRDERRLKLLADALRKHGQICRVIRDRRKSMKPLGEEIVRLSTGARTIERPVGFGVGRNDPCPCGSGKKYKKCCLGKC